MLVGISRIMALVFLLAGIAFGGDDAKTLAAKIQTAEAKKDYAAMIDAGKQLLALDPKSAVAMNGLGIGLHMSGKYDEALEYHKMLAASGAKDASTGAYNAACAYALKGDTEAAFEWLEKSHKMGFDQVGQVKMDSDLKSLHNDPRFKQILEAMADPAPAKTAVAAAGDETKKAAPQAFIASQFKERRGTRVAAFGDAWCKQVSIEYGPVNWKDEYEDQIKSGKLDGQRWRTGSDFWTNVDASTSFVLGDKTFDAGEYYLMTERSKDGQYTVILVPAAEIRKAQIDAFQAPESKGGVAVAMKHESIDEADELVIRLQTENQGSTKGNLTIKFGTHQLSAPFEIKL